MSASAAKKSVLITTQITLIASVAYLWFDAGVHGIWNHVSHTNKDSLSALSLKPYSKDDASSQSQFALMSALTHTFVLVMGILVSSAISKALSSAEKSQDKKRTGGTLKLLASISFLLLFFIAVKTYFKYSFNAREGLVYQVSSAFFYESGVEPFAILGSTSYSIWMACGFAVRAFSQETDGLYPKVISRWLPTIAGSLVLVHFFSLHVLFPTYHNFVKPILVPDRAAEAMHDHAFVEGFSLLAAMTHGALFAAGMLVRLARTEGLRSIAPEGGVLRFVVGVVANFFVVVLVIVGFCLAMNAPSENATAGAGLRFMAQAVMDYAVEQLRFAVTILASAFPSDRSLGLLCVLVSVGAAVSVVVAGWVVEPSTVALGDLPAKLQAMRPFTLKQADALFYWVPFLCTAVGLAHPHDPVMFFDTLVRVFVFLECTLMPGSFLMIIVGKVLGTRIQDMDKPHDFRSPWLLKEAAETSVALYIFACLAAWPLTLYRLGLPCALVDSLEETGDGLAFYSLKTFLGLLGADWYMYWKHRILHSRTFFAFHRSHHMFRDPTPFAGFAVHPVEALVTFGPVLFAMCPWVGLCIPLHYPVLAFLAILNLYLHCGYQIWIVEKTLAPLFINTSAFHNAHHFKTRTHFGEILWLWDWINSTGEHSFGWDPRGEIRVLGATIASVK